MDVLISRTGDVIIHYINIIVAHTYLCRYALGMYIVYLHMKE